jgi:hypothetical protein
MCLVSHQKLDHLCTIQENEGPRRSLEEHLILLRQSQVRECLRLLLQRKGRKC